MDIYSDLPNARILEIGSQDVNGTLRDHAPASTHYVGVDMEAGAGVDIVVEAGSPLPMADESFDLILASSVFEHDAAFWVTFVEMCRKVRKGGYVYINAPSNGTFHRYPEDHWRFYPDSGYALARWATSVGQEMTLVESFVADRISEVYNDFVAVFRKGPADEPFPADAIYRHFPCANVHTWKSTELLYPRDESQDTTLLAETRAELAALHTHVVSREQRITSLEEQLSASAINVAALEAERIRIEARLNSAGEELALKTDELAQLREKLALAENVLAQRSEEIEQTRAELEAARQQMVDAEAKTERLQARLVDADAWVFRLAGDRREADMAAQEARRQLAALERDHDLVRARMANAAAELEQTKLAMLSSTASIAELTQTTTSNSREIEDLRLQNGELRQVALTSKLEMAEKTDEVGVLTQLLRQSEEAAKALEAAEERATSAAAAAEAARLSDIARMEQRLRDEETRRAVHEDRGVWLQNLSAANESKPVWWLLIPQQWRRKMEYRRLARLELFDAAAYLDRYPDVAAHGMDPLRHYILHGIAENRQR